MVQKLSRREELAQDGVLEAAYTNKWFLKIREALSIGLVQFSFVMKGNAKAEHFDVYMSYDRFRSWVKDFTRDSRYGQRVLAAERGEGEKYPKHYLWVTGENGSKTVGIANSTTEGAYVINGSTIGRDGKKVYANVQIKEVDSFFESLAFWLGVVDGRISPSKGSYIDKIREIYLASATERAKHFAPAAEETTEYSTGEEAEPEKAEATEAPKEDPVAEAKPETSAEAKAVSKAKGNDEDKAVRVMNFVTSGAFFFVDTEAERKKAEADRTEKVAAYAKTAPKEVESNLSEIIFYKTQRNKVADWYGRLKTAVSQKATLIKVKVKPCGERDGKNQYVFQGIVS